MSSVDPAADRLKTQIATAFAARPYPGDEHLLADASEADLESRALRAAFVGKAWTEVTVAMVGRYKDALPLFTPAAFAYYLPAFLIACIDAPAQVDVALDSVLFSLTPPRRRSGWRWRFFLDRAALFDPRQAEAIRGFLEWAAQREAEDWAASGKRPPPARIGAARTYWTEAAAGAAEDGQT